MKGEGVATALAVALFAAVGSAQEATQRVDIVRVIGCLRHTVPDVWILSAATDPVTVSRGSEPVQPPPNEPTAAPSAGRHIAPDGADKRPARPPAE